MSQDSGSELKVGAFVLMAVIALTFFVISVSDFSIFEKGRHIQVVFGFASGLRESAPVRLAGVEVGLIKKLKVFVDSNDGGKTKVRMNIWIKEDISIPADSKVTINQLGILGEKYLEIIPGSSTDFIQDGGVVVGHDPVPIEKITERVDTLMSKLQDTIDSVNNGLLTDKNKKSLQDALEGFGALGADLKEGRGTLGKLLTDESIYKNLDDLTLDLKSNPWKLLYRPKSKE
ncbi:MAG: MCE family protein [Candidatus Omnitrophica bacterium]|nr:MCE family protein [Candidatus Omnitrophota bacterium]